MQQVSAEDYNGEASKSALTSSKLVVKYRTYSLREGKSEAIEVKHGSTSCCYFALLTCIELSLRP